MPITGRLQLNRAALDKEVRRVATTNIRRFQTRTESYAVPRTPVDTGRLRASYDPTPVRKQGDNYRATLTNTANYAVFVFGGTRYMRARPVMVEAARQAAKETGFVFTEQLKYSA